MITSEDLGLARQAIKNMGTAFEDLVQICKSLDKVDQKRIFSPDTFGPISQFLAIGNGYEPGKPGPQFVSCERLLEIIEDEVIYDDEDEEMDSEDEEFDHFELAKETDF